MAVTVPTPLSLLCPQSLSVPFSLQCLYGIVLASHLSTTSQYWHNSQRKLNCLISLLILQLQNPSVYHSELRSPRGWCPLLWSSSGKFTHLYPHWHSITVSPFSDPSPRASYSLLTPTATAYFLRKRGLAQNFLISLVHLKMVLCFVTCFLFLFCPVGVLSLKRDIINTVRCPAHKSTAWYSFT